MNWLRRFFCKRRFALRITGFTESYRNPEWQIIDTRNNTVAYEIGWATKGDAKWQLKLWERYSQ